METANANPIAYGEQPVGTFLDRETRSMVDTATAAYYLNRRMQTLQKWRSTGTGPVKPVMVHGRLAWPVQEIKKLLGVAA